MEATAKKATFQKYPAYKNSGVEWLGEIPEHWEIGKLGTLLKPVSIKNRPDLPLLSITREAGVIERNMEDDSENHNFIPDDLSGYKVLNEGQFGMNKMKAWQGSYGIAPMTGIVSPAYYVFDFNSSINPMFFHLAIRSKNYVAFFGQASDGVRVGQWDLSKTRMKEIPFFIPPLSEQTAIAAFLDDKTAKIDRAITQKEKMIALLKERKQIIIQNAVTKGLDPNAKMKHSGVEWIWEIPEHWEVKRLKFVGNAIIGLTYDPNDLCDEHEGTLVLRSSNLQEGKFKYGEKENVYVKSRISKKLIIQENDILICSRNGSRDLIGKCAIATKNDVGVSFGAFTTVFRSRINTYLFHILNSEIFKYLSGMFLTSTINQLTIGNLNSIEVPLPPESEREQIAKYIETQSAQIDRAIKLQEQQIEKLKELKSTLIDSAVTGKIKMS